VNSEEKVGLWAFGGVVVLAFLSLGLRPPSAPKPDHIRSLAGQVLMGISEDDSPCTDEPVLIWGAAPLQKFADEVGASGIGAIDLPANLRSVILQENPPRLYIFGHGNDWVQTVDQCKYFLTDPAHNGLNLDLVKDRYCHSLACLTAVTLGPAIVNAGAKGYFGYDEEFELVLKVAPGSGRYVEAPVCGDIEIERALLEGQRDLKAIYDRAIASYNQEIAYWQEHWAQESCDGVRISEGEAQMLISVLIHNRDALRYYPVAG
jgi:hypothetical protein